MIIHLLVYLQASLVQDYIASKQCDSSISVITHIVGAAHGSTNILATLHRLCHELNTRFGLQMEVPEDFKYAVFFDLLLRRPYLLK